MGGLVSVAAGQESEGQVADTLFFLRNKVAFHYDAKCIYQGFEHVFISGKDSGQRPFISRGTTLKNTRFFFADAAAQGYLSSRVGAAGVPEFLKTTSKLLADLNVALVQIIEAFIQNRGYAWRSESRSA